MLDAMLDTLVDALPAAATTAQIAELKRLPELEGLPELDYGASGGGSQPRMALAYLVNDPKRNVHSSSHLLDVTYIPVYCLLYTQL